MDTFFPGRGLVEGNPTDAWKTAVRLLMKQGFSTSLRTGAGSARPLSDAGERGGAALGAPGESIAVEEPSTLPVEKRRTVAGEHAGVGPQRRSASVEDQRERRATADEARATAEPMPGGPAVLDHADKTERDRCPEHQTAVARRLPPR